MFCSGLGLLSSARRGELQTKALLVSPGCSWPGSPSAPNICQATFLQAPPHPWLLSSGSKAYLGPLGELPLGPTGLVLAGFPLHGPGQPRCLAEIIVDRAVKAWRQHLPAAHGAVLEALAAGPGALAPPAGLPPPEQRKHKEHPGKGDKGQQGCASLPQQLLLWPRSSHLRKCDALPVAGNLGPKFFSFSLQGDTRSS